MSLPRPEPATVIDFATRQPMEGTDTDNPKSHGGRREPLGLLTITIPNYAKHQGSMRPGHKRLWVKFERVAVQELSMAGASFMARALFYELVILSDEGSISDMAPARLGKLLDLDYRVMKRALDQLAEIGLVQVQVKCEARAKQVQSKGEASAEQVNSKVIHLTDPPVDGVTAPQTDRQNRQTEREEKEGIQEGDSEPAFSHPPALLDSPTSGPTSPTVSAVDLIVPAMAAQGVPFKGIDPIIGYRAKAGTMMTRTGDVDPLTYATWACMAIATVGNCPDWEVRVNTALKSSRIGGGYVPPEAPRRQDMALSAEIQATMDEFTAMGI